MRTVTTSTNVYTFEELSESAQETAISNNSSINVNEGWWENTYEDAANVGLKITSFDMYQYCNGNFIQDACYTANKIKDEHGEQCETYKTAEKFLTERDELIDTAPKDENGDFENEYELDQKLDDLEEDFEKSILEDYRIILRKEYEYLISEEAIKESLISSEMEFTENGEDYSG
jgi:hypothetical protein